MSTFSFRGATVLPLTLLLVSSLMVFADPAEARKSVPSRSNAKPLTRSAKQASRIKNVKQLSDTKSHSALRAVDRYAPSNEDIQRHRMMQSNDAINTDLLRRKH